MKKTITGAIIALAGLLAGCGGAGAPAMPPSVHTSKAAGTRVVIQIPPKSSTASSAARQPQYVSPSTQSITVSVDGGPATAQNLTPGSPNCDVPAPLSPLTCTVNISAAPGTHTFTFVTYDGLNGTGNVLSTNSVSQNIVANQSNTVNVTLDGVPKSFQVLPLPSLGAIQGTATSGFQFLGRETYTMEIDAVDADGNYILGPGAPALRVSVSNASVGSGVTVTAASNGNPNEFVVKSTGFGSATLAIAAGSALTTNVPLVSAAVTTTIAGAAGTNGFADGSGTAANFYYPQGITYDSADGSLYVADTFNNEVRKVTPAGAVTTFAGSRFIPKIGAPRGIAYDPDNGNLYLTTDFNCQVKQVTAAGVISVLAGYFVPYHPPDCAFADGTGLSALFWYPMGVGYGNGNLYVTDTFNCALRQVTTGGVVKTIAGNHNVCEFADGTGSNAYFRAPHGVAYDPKNGDLYVADTENCVIRQVTAAGVVTTIAGEPNMCGFADGSGKSAKFLYPSYLTYDQDDGDLYVTDMDNNAIRQVTTDGVVSTVAGGPGKPGFADGIGAKAHFYYPAGITYDPGNGDLYVTDTFNSVIRQIQL